MDTSRTKIATALIFLFGLGAVLVAVFVLNDWTALFDDSRLPDDNDLAPSRLTALSGRDRPESLHGEDSEPTEPGQITIAGESGRTESIDPSFLTSFVRGSVEDESGEALSGALVRIESTLPGVLRSILPGGRYQRSAESNGDGTFSIPLPAEGAFRLNVSKESYAAFAVSLVLPGDDLTITLARGAILDGEVVDEETGRPVDGVLVRARRDFQVIEARTDDTGRFRVADLPEGPVALECFHEEYDLERRDGIRVYKDSENFVSLELRPGGDVEGRVLALSTGEPLAGASVRYSMRTWDRERRNDLMSRETGTDKKGRFLFESVSRRGYRLEAEAEGYTVGIPEPLDLTGESEKVFEIYLKEESAASGRVIDPEGRPAAGARVVVLKGTKYGERTLETETDGAGLFRVSGIEGGVPFSLIACGKQSAPGLLDRLMVAEGAIVEDLEVRLQRPAAISGQALGPDGNPLPGVRVTLDGIKGFLMRYNDAAPLTMTDSEGRFGFTGLAGGTYTLSASKGALRSDADEIFLQEGEEQERVLDLAEGLTLRGTVVDLGGAPVDDVLVTAIDFTLEEPSASPDGTMKPSRRKAKTAGDDKKTTRKKERTPSQKKANRKPDPKGPARGSARSRTDGLDQRIKRALNSRADRPIPLEFEIVRKLGYSRFRGNARTDESGAFCLTGLRPDDCLIVSFKRYGYDSEVLSNLSPSDGPVSAVLSPRVALMGQVIDYATSAPVQRFRVEWFYVKNDYRSTDEIVKARGFRGSSRNFGSADGTFHIDGMEPGEIIMRATARGYRASAPRRFVMLPGYGVTSLAFSLDRGGSVQGRILASDGSIVERVPVYLRKWVKERERKGRKKSRVRTLSRHSDSKGRFLFTDVDEGVYEILVGDAQKPVVDPVRVKLAQGANASKNITLRDLGEVEIRVRGQGGISCRAEVEIKGGPGRLSMRKVTGNLGIASFPNLLSGKYALKIKAKGYKSWSQALTVKDGREFKKEIELQVSEK